MLGRCFVPVLCAVCVLDMLCVGHFGGDQCTSRILKHRNDAARGFGEMDFECSVRAWAACDHPGGVLGCRVLLTQQNHRGLVRPAEPVLVVISSPFGFCFCFGI